MKMRKKRHVLYGIIGMLFLVMGIGFTGCGNPVSQEADLPAGDMTVHFLDVGQGLSILVQSENETLIYDGGDRDTSSFVVAYLKEQGVTKIDYLISSHYDADHLSGLIGCLNAFEVEHVIGSDYTTDTKTYESFMGAVSDQGLTVEYPTVGEEFPFGSGKFVILAPEVIDEGDSNENSVVIRLLHGKNSFLFTGDADSTAEEAMCQSGLDLDCDVLVLSHHGSATATSWEFLEKTVPEYAVISCGLGNSYGHPHKDTMDKLESMEIPVFRTDLQGTIIVASDGEHLSWEQEPCDDYSPGEAADQGTVVVTDESTNQDTQEEMVWLSKSGSKYHRIPDCGNMNPDTARQVTKEEAQALGMEACKNCYP